MSIIRPSSDLLVTDWTPSSGSDAYAVVDETTASDADYISTSTPGAVARIALDQAASRVVMRDQVFTKQPQGSVSSDAYLAWNATNPYTEVVSGKKINLYQIGSAASFENLSGGKSVFLWSTNSARILLENPINLTKNFIFVIRYRNYVSATNTIFVSGKENWGNSNGFMIVVSSSSTDSIQVNGGDGYSFPSLSIPGVGALDNKDHTLAVRYAGTSVYVAYDGKYMGSVSIATPAGTCQSGIGIGNYAGTSNNNTPSRYIYMAGILRSGDIVSLSANPWQIFKPKKTPVFLPNALPTDNHKLTYRASSPEGDRGLIARVVEYGNIGIVTSKQPWRKQPQGAVEVDWGNPITSGLVDVFDFKGYPKSLVLNTQPTFFATRPALGVPTAQGKALSSLSNGFGVYFARGDGLYATAAQSHVSVSRLVTGTNFGGIFLTSDSVNTNQVFGIGYKSPTVAYCYNGSNPEIGCSGWYGKSSVKTATTNGFLTKLYDAANVVGSTNAGITARSTSRIRFFGDHASYYVNGTAAMHMMWNRALSPAEIKSISAAPWQIFKPKKRISYFDAPKLIATRTPTLTTSPADYTIDLSSGEAGLITDYSKLGVEFEST